MGKYLKYRNTYFKDDWQTFFLFYEYFYQPKIRHYLPSPLRAVIHSTRQVIIFWLAVFKFHLLFFKAEQVEANWLIKTESKGDFSSQTFLIKENNRLFIKKQVFNKQAYLAFQNYYQRYHCKSEKLVLAPSNFDNKEQTIKSDFIPAPSLAHLAAQGKISFKKAIKIFQEVCQEIDQLYSKNGSGLVHGDFSAVNLLVSPNTYYLIDCLDSFRADKDYDKYHFLRSIFKYLKNKKLDYQTTCCYLTISQGKFLEFEHIYQQRRDAKQGKTVDK